MELIYVWAEKYRTYTDTEINLSDKFKVHYDKQNQTISIQKNDNYTNIYPDYVTNISAIVGKNSAGKSNLLDLIGMRISDRNSQKEEYKAIMKEKYSNQLGYTNDDIKEEKRKFLYFMLYYFGKDEDDEELYCIEGNYIRQFLNIFSNKERIDKVGCEYNPINYRLGKNWFPFVCAYNHEKKKLEYILDTQDSPIKVHDKLVSILFREKFNESYYDRSSFKPDDEPKIAVPRRTSELDSNYTYKKADFLFKQIKKRTNMYVDENYYINIECRKENIRDEKLIDGKDLIRFKIKGQINEHQVEICRVLYSYVLRVLDSTLPSEYDENKKLLRKNILNEINNIKPKEISYKGLIEYYRNCISQSVTILFTTKNNRFDDMTEEAKENIVKESENDINHTLNTYDAFVKRLNDFNKENCYFKISNNDIKIAINKDCQIEKILNFLKLTVDEGYSDISKKSYNPFINFFNVTWKHLSDGELAYLGFYAALDEQISINTKGKKDYILLLDEPEIRMHPELARNFINDLLNFLSQYKDNNFQIIVSSHSPFIISDIPKLNVITIKKSGCTSIVEPCNIDTFAQNIHTLLKDSFFMKSTMGEFARKQIQAVDDYLNALIYKTKYHNNGMTLDKAEKIISLIGEPLIKSSLENKLMKVKRNYCSDNLKNAISSYDKLSPKEKERLIQHIIKGEQK